MKTGPFVMSTRLSWALLVAEFHAGGWVQVASSLPAGSEDSTNTTL